MTTSTLTLASTSPRRKELLALLQLPFLTVDPDFVERPSRDHPWREALSHARGKAAAAHTDPDALVLACDTLIELDGHVLGKPDSEEEARAMLRRLQGRQHLVHSAVVLRRHTDGLSEEGIETVRVHMRPLTDQQLERYLRSREWVGKAGGYGIQGPDTVIASIDGDYTAVVGLPLRLVAGLLQKYLLLPVDIDTIYRDRPYANWSSFPAS